MARSFGSYIPSQGGEFSHQLSASKMRVALTDGQMSHSVLRDGLEAKYPIALSIGSGRVGQSFAVLIAGKYFQSPISWFAQTVRWGISPGFEQERHPDFDRPITDACLSCHSSGKTGISCERCHGDGAVHSRAPAKDNIIQPARLAHSKRDAVCEQCHLQGAARIMRPGKTERDYVPGTAIEDVFTTFVRERQDFRIVSHAEQLRASACAMASEGRLWCGSCHDPHPRSTVTRATYQNRCQSCHAGVQKKHVGPAEDCVGCHMPSRPVSDVAHTVYTDHRISRRPSSAVAGASTLKAWRAVEDGSRGIALARAATGEIEAASLLLSPLARSLPKDIDVLVAAGSTALGLKRPAEALRHFGAARKLEPNLPEHYFREGLAREASGDLVGAARDYRAALLRKPEFFDAAARLASLERQSGDLAGYRRTLEAFLATMPQNITVRKLLTVP